MEIGCPIGLTGERKNNMTTNNKNDYSLDFNLAVNIMDDEIRNETIEKCVKQEILQLWDSAIAMLLPRIEN